MNEGSANKNGKNAKENACFPTFKATHKKEKGKTMSTKEKNQYDE